jgi:hypothetical protein
MTGCRHAPWGPLEAPVAFKGEGHYSGDRRGRVLRAVRRGVKTTPTVSGGRQTGGTRGVLQGHRVRTRSLTYRRKFPGWRNRLIRNASGSSRLHQGCGVSGAGLASGW